MLSTSNVHSISFDHINAFVSSLINNLFQLSYRITGIQKLSKNKQQFGNGKLHRSFVQVFNKLKPTTQQEELFSETQYYTSVAIEKTEVLKVIRN